MYLCKLNDEVMNPVIIGILLPLSGTVLGSSFVFFMRKEIPDRMQKTLLGFASGVMVAASVWSLLIPSIEMAGKSVIPETPQSAHTNLSTIGFAAGFVLMMVMDVVSSNVSL